MINKIVPYQENNHDKLVDIWLQAVHHFRYFT